MFVQEKLSYQLICRSMHTALKLEAVCLAHTALLTLSKFAKSLFFKSHRVTSCTPLFDDRQHFISGSVRTM